VPALVVVPLAVHAVMSRALVLPEDTTLRITLMRGSAVAAADGQSATALEPGDELWIRPGPALQQVRLPASDSFVARMRGKLRLGIPLKNERHDSSSEVSDGTS
jgi:NAD kinase